MSLPIRRRSHEILFDICHRITVEEMAKRLFTKEITLRKQTEPSRYEQEDLPFDPAGRINFIDRTAITLRSAATDAPDLALELMNYLARELNGVFIPNDKVDSIVSALTEVRREDRGKRK